MHADPQRSGAFAMNDSDGEEATLTAFTQVILQQASDFTGLEGVKIEFGADLDLHRVFRQFLVHFRIVEAISCHRASTSLGPREGLPALANQ